MLPRYCSGWIAVIVILFISAGSTQTDAAFIPDDNEKRQVTLASRRPARQPRLGPRTMSHLVLAATSPAPVVRSRPQTSTVPDGWLVCARRHADGQLAAVIGHADGTMTARLWPSTDSFSSGFNSLAAAQRAADALAHGGNNCSCFRPWNFS
jgi:hypothetical protein